MMFVHLGSVCVTNDVIIFVDPQYFQTGHVTPALPAKLSSTSNATSSLISTPFPHQRTGPPLIVQKSFFYLICLSTSLYCTPFIAILSFSDIILHHYHHHRLSAGFMATQKKVLTSIHSVFGGTTRILSSPSGANAVCISDREFFLKGWAS